MNIGVDIDGVLANIGKWFSTHTAKYLGKPQINPNGYYAYERFDITKAEGDKYWDTALWEYYADGEVIDGASDALHELRRRGHKIIINTARWRTETEDAIGKRTRKLVLDWLAKHNLPYDEIAFSARHGGNKLTVAKQYKLDVHIDDAVQEIQLVSPYCPVIIFDAPYNVHINLPNTTHVKNWNDILTKI